MARIIVVTSGKGGGLAKHRPAPRLLQALR